MARLLLVAALVAAALAIAGCGGGGGGGAADGTTAATTATATSDRVAVQTDDENRFARPSSVGDGQGGAPGVAASVRRAAAAAGCSVRTFPSEGRNHVDGEPEYKQSLPPTSGNHNVLWANWGLYDTPVPYRHLVHNLEHGAVEIYEGQRLSPAAKLQVRDFWALSPPFMMVLPGDRLIPPRGVVVVSWQRWMVCRTFGPKVLAAVRTYRNVYRGTGPEGSNGVNLPERYQDQPHGPEPAEPDPGA